MAGVVCPECSGTGRVEERPRCEWCFSAVAEHSCDGCSRRLCIDCLFDGSCLGCMSEADIERIFDLEEAA